ncbi:GNAT family N-acetyltransferase [Gorillibacterium timonense]|uniref:GNAT family N-acetyltransferase n=1 Tax=Gorillibacterium timonense TaxID=1689269 RepID=UPI00071C2D6D|nr:GNAT family N-acetyltransferase [Gorillibacterium timonense]
MTQQRITVHSVQNEEDLQACFAIRVQVFVEEQNVPSDEEIDEFDASWDACRHFLVKVDGKPAATGRYRSYKESPPTVKLQRIAVLPEYRGTGLGRVLILAMEADAKKAGADYSVLDAQCQAEPFYRKLGYETVSPETFLDAGIPHVRMQKRL